MAPSAALRSSDALYLGKAANEENVETMDLSRFRIIDFATRRLVPGDIDGLTQPALALDAPQVARVEGNGLLTMEENAALKLDADWVVLSACNTAARRSGPRRQKRPRVSGGLFSTPERELCS